MNPNNNAYYGSRGLPTPPTPTSETRVDQSSEQAKPSTTDQKKSDDR